MNIAPPNRIYRLRERLNSLFFQRKYSKGKKRDGFISFTVSPRWLEILKRSTVAFMFLTVLAIFSLYLMMVSKKNLPFVDPLKCPPKKAVTLITTKRPIKYIGTEADHEDRFTLVLSTFKRPDLLKRSIAHYSKCKEIDAIRVVWSESLTPPIPSVLPEFFSEIKDVRYDLRNDSSLNSRFEPMEGVRTEAMFSIDDDIEAPCSDLARAFEVWKKDKWNLVGFYPRLHIRDQDCGFKYQTSHATFMTYGMYSIILTKAAMLHRDYLEHYTKAMPKEIRSMVASWMNCEDIAMQIMVSNLTREPPRFVHSHRAVDWGKGLTKVKGISSSKMHALRRDMCLTEFSRFYDGVLPLFPAHFESMEDRLTPITETLYGIFHGRI